MRLAASTLLRAQPSGLVFCSPAAHSASWLSSTCPSGVQAGLDTMQAAAKALLAAPSPGVAAAPRNSGTMRFVARTARPQCLLAGRQAPVAAAGRAGAAAGALPTQLGSRHTAPLRRCLAAPASSRLRRRAAASGARAMVNVDVSPSVVLGVGLIGAGVSLWQIRRWAVWQTACCGAVWARRAGRVLGAFTCRSGAGMAGQPCWQRSSAVPATLPPPELCPAAGHVSVHAQQPTTLCVSIARVQGQALDLQGL